MNGIRTKVANSAIVALLLLAEHKPETLRQQLLQHRDEIYGY
jgi:hypothetical protein